MNPESEISCHTTLTECNNWFILPQIHSLLQFVLGVQAKSEKNLSCHRESNSTAKYQIPNFQFRLDSIYFLFLPLKNVVMISVQSSLDLETSLAPLSQFFFFSSALFNLVSSFIQPPTISSPGMLLTVSSPVLLITISIGHRIGKPY